MTDYRKDIEEMIQLVSMVVANPEDRKEIQDNAKAFAEALQSCAEVDREIASRLRDVFKR